MPGALPNLDFTGGAAAGGMAEAKSGNVFIVASPGETTAGQPSTGAWWKYILIAAIIGAAIWYYWRHRA